MTEAITLRTAFANYPHVRAIKDGSVASERIRFDFEEVPVMDGVNHPADAPAGLRSRLAGILKFVRED